MLKQTAVKVLGARRLKQIIRACHDGDIALVRRALADGLDPNILVSSLGTRPLTAAARGGQLQVLRLLLQRGADPNLKDTGLSMPPGGTPLENACEQGHLAFAKALVQSGADVNKKGYWPPLLTAISYGQVELVRFLLRAHAKLDSSWLLQAIRAGKPDLIDELLKAGAEINYRNNEGYTALHRAAGHDAPSLVALLLKHGANPNLQSYRRKETPLTIAAERGNLEVVRTLLTAGANATLAGPKGQTPERRARLFGQNEVAKLLRACAGQQSLHTTKHAVESRQNETTPGQVPPFKMATLKKPATLHPFAGHGHNGFAPALSCPKMPGRSEHSGASDFVAFVHEWGYPEWVVLAAEAPLAEVLALYCECFPVAECLPSVPIKRSSAADKGMAQWVPFVQPVSSKWTAIFRVVCSPIGEEDVAQAAKDAARLSRELESRALSFLGEDTSGAMQCDLFAAGKRSRTQCWDNQGAAADGFFGDLGLYIPACYSQNRGDSVWLSVWPSSQSKIASAGLILPKI